MPPQNKPVILAFGLVVFLFRIAFALVSTVRCEHGVGRLGLTLPHPGPLPKERESSRQPPGIRIVPAAAPGPLPRGERTAIAHSPEVRSANWRSSHPIRQLTGTVSPSPGGEGRGEGEPKSRSLATAPQPASSHSPRLSNLSRTPRRGCRARSASAFKQHAATECFIDSSTSRKMGLVALPFLPVAR